MDSTQLSGGAPRRPGYGFIVTLGPEGSLSPVQHITESHPIFANCLRNPVRLQMRYLFDTRIAAAAGLDFQRYDGDDDYAPQPQRAPAAGELPRGGKRARAAASEEAILGLPEVAGRSRSGEDCAVYLQGFRADETLRAMPCSHAFHHLCISQWLRCSAVCPLCRSPPAARGGGRRRG